ncbi:DUF1120 domain-containing protein [Enterobacter bugandensis]|uniref:DUF1120 domain-containing protein n=1 Tax=Enterobacter bugandensis TaxID=881260 RepID=UPI0020044A80|nr:DUF1120 domain-containing protein [Enterobacter bugandensis]MCK6964514.1 DUF1120 domain-containing protein [Enterobacter bugandensis]
MEMNKNILASLVLISSGLSLSAHAADSFNINVTGVISPAACQANITGGETIDYGTIPANTLTADARTLLPAKQTAFTITCDAPAKLGFRTVDNRAASKMTSDEVVTFDWGSTWNTSLMNGLGVDGQGNNIGGWAAELTAMSSDTVSAPEGIYSTDDGATWAKRSTPAVMSFLSQGDFVYSVSKPGSAVPVAFSTFTGTLAVQAVIAPASTLDLSQPVTLDGSVTVEMVYL